MTVRIYAKHLPYADGHLEKVSLDMEHAGDPTIRVIEFENNLIALEGSHRLFLANKYGLVPKVIILEPDFDLGNNERYKHLMETLPYYDFDYVLKLHEKDFYAVKALA